MAVATVVVAVLDRGLAPRLKPGMAVPVVAAAAAVVVEAAAAAAAAAAVVAAATDPRGLRVKFRPPPTVEGGAVLAVEAGATPRENAVVDAGAAAAVVMGEANRDGPEGAEAEVAWVYAGGAGVDDGLTPKLKPPP